MRKRTLFERLLNRVGFSRTPQRRSFFAGAAGNRLNLDWVMGPSSADDEVKADGRKLRDRARSLRRDNPWAARFVNLQVEGILGAHGVTMQARVGNSRGGVNEATNKKIEQKFAAWAERHADVAGRLSFSEHVRLAVETWKTEGEAFLEMVPMASNPFGFALRALDPDQIDDTLNQAPADGVAEIKMGVELDAFGRPVAYHVWERHPSETARGGVRARRRVSAAQIIHLGRQSRAGQTRYVTPFAPVMQDLKMLGGLQEAVLVLQRTAACKMGFVSVDPELASPLEPEAGSTTVAWDAEPGKIEQLPLGMQFTAWDPGQPGTEYDPFTKNVLRGIAAGLGVAYSSLTGDLGEANYSSARVGMLSERDGYERDQQYLIAALHKRVYEAWLAWSFLSGGLDLVPGNAEKYPVEWVPRAFPWIDPEKDIAASLLEVGAGVNSLTRIARTQGRDLADVLAERKAEQEMATAMGVELFLGPGNAPPPPAPPTPEQQAADDRSRTIAEEMLAATRGTKAAVEYFAAKPNPPITVNTPDVRIEPAPITVNLTLDPPRQGTKTITLARNAAGEMVAATVTAEEGA